VTSGRSCDCLTPTDHLCGGVAAPLIDPLVTVVTHHDPPRGVVSRMDDRQPTRLGHCPSSIGWTLVNTTPNPGTTIQKGHSPTHFRSGQIPASRDRYRRQDHAPAGVALPGQSWPRHLGHAHPPGAETPCITPTFGV